MAFIKLRHTALAVAFALLAPTAGLAAPHSPTSFPQGFLWGAATAAHQVEGHVNNDWVAWEKQKGSIDNGDTSEVGVDEYRRYNEDFALAQGMGMNVHRLSIEWARIEPKEGEIDWKEVDHYHAVFESLKAHHLAAMVTLFHFTLPPWVAEQGGWLNAKTEDDFARFATFCGHQFGGQVDWWCTLNEPNVYAFQSFDAGLWPPQHKERAEALRVMANLLAGHAKAYRALHAADRVAALPGGAPARVGVANHIALFDPLRPFNLADVATAHFNDDVFNQAPLRSASFGIRRFQIPGTQGVDESNNADASAVDFVGVNYYTRWMCVAGAKKDRIPNPGSPVTANGWEDYPQGMYRALKLADHYTHLPDGRHVPIIITENGVDDPTGTVRSSFLVRHLAEVAHALRDGVDVRGYIHWTLADNFEWNSGYAPKFGLYRVDRAAGAQLKRVETPAVGVFKRIIAANALPADLLGLYMR